MTSRSRIYLILATDLVLVGILLVLISLVGVWESSQVRVLDTSIHLGRNGVIDTIFDGSSVYIEYSSDSLENTSKYDYVYSDGCYSYGVNVGDTSNGDLTVVPVEGELYGEPYYLTYDVKANYIDIYSVGYKYNLTSLGVILLGLHGCSN